MIDAERAGTILKAREPFFFEGIANSLCIQKYMYLFCIVFKVQSQVMVVVMVAKKTDQGDVSPLMLPPLYASRSRIGNYFST